jgi:hypothetical protein
LSGRGGLGFGGFLVGLGVGWVVFSAMSVSWGLFAWMLILAGAAMIVSSLIPRRRFNIDVGGLTRGLMGGLVLSLVATSGLVFVDLGGSSGLGDYRAQETRTFSGALTAGGMLLDVNNFNGPVSVSTWARDEYRVDVLIRAKGVTVADAEDNLERFVTDFDEGASGGKGTLVLRYDIPINWHSRYSVQVEAFLPARAKIDLDLDSSNGAISLKDIDGGTIELQTSNGAIDFDDVTGSRIDAVTSNGRVEGRIEAPDTSISTSNGGIDLALPCTASGRYVLRTSNAQVRLRVSPSSGVGYDMDLSTSNGNIDVGLPNLEYGVNQRTSKEARTSGFEDKAVKITVVASTSNAGMDVDI